MPTPTLNFPILRNMPAEPIERVKIAQFDDGYEKRRVSGLNPIAERWTLTIVVTPSIITDFKNFIQQVGKHSPFLWTSPESNTVKTWLIDNYGYEYRYHEDPANIEWIWTLKIKQVF